MHTYSYRHLKRKIRSATVTREQRASEITVTITTELWGKGTFSGKTLTISAELFFFFYLLEVYNQAKTFVVVLWLILFFTSLHKPTILKTSIFFSSLCNC